MANSASKFGRNYDLFVETQNGKTLEIKPPFTIQFDIIRNVLSSANICQIRIFNLSENNRKQIRKNVNNYGDQRLVTLQAGYGTNLPIIFTGSIRQAWSVREGSNFITTIESFDGGFALINSVSTASFPAGTPQRTQMQNLIQSMPGVALGSIGDYPGTSSRGNAYSGSTAEILNGLSGNGFFIDNGKANCLNNNECLPGGISLISSASGLLGTPILEETILNFEMIFEPGLIVGQQVFLDSSTGANFNGLCKVISVEHRGMISESVCGEAITRVGLLYGIDLKTVAAS